MKIWQCTTDKQITIILNMLVAPLIAMFMGILLRIIGLPCWLVCGSVAATAVIAEHFLTVHPLPILKYITSLKEKKGKK